MRCTILLLCLCSVSCLAPGSSMQSQFLPSKTDAFYPCLVGSKWSYEQRGSAKLFDDYTIDSVEVDHSEIETTIITVLAAAYKKGGNEEIKVTPNGVFLTVSNGRRLNLTYCVLKFPIRPGESWENGMKYCTEQTGVQVGVEHVMTNKGWELIAVPAGMYWAIRVDCINPDEVPLCRGPDAGLSSTWYAPGVGIVKYKDTYTDCVLKSFTPGKMHVP